MSRIGLQPIQIPKDVTVTFDKDVIVRGPKGENVVPIPRNIRVTEEGGLLMVANKGNANDSAVHGLTRAILANAITGVSVGWTKKLELAGVGYRAAMAGNVLELSIGFSHTVTVTPPPGITLSVVDGKIVVSGVSRQLVGQIASDIRRKKPPEPYKGKGIKYEGEVVRRKAGKAAKAVGGAPGAK